MTESNEKVQIDLIVLIKLMRQNIKSLFKWGAIGVVVGLIIAFSIPAEFTSSAKIAPEGKEDGISASAGALASVMGVRTGGSEGISDALYVDIIQSTPFLMEMASIQVEVEDEKVPLHKYLMGYQRKPWWSYILGLPRKVISLFGGSSNDIPFEESLINQQIYLETISGKISATQDKTVGLITIKSVAQNPKIAKQVNDSIIVKLQRYMNDYRTINTKQKLATSEVMLELSRNSFYHADELYATAVDRNQNLISKSAQIKIERLKSERDLAFSIYQQMSSKVETEKINLLDKQSIATVIQPPTFPVNASAPSKAFILVLYTMLFVSIVGVRIILKHLRKI